MPGVTIRKAREKSFESLRAAFTACQAISMAMTVVLPLPGRHLHGQAEKLGIGLLVGLGDLIQKSLRRRTLRRDLRQPDDRLDGFDLAEEGLRTDELVMAPMLQEPLGDAGHAPVGRIAQAPPPIDVAADLVDQRVLGVGLQVEGGLRGGRLLPRGRNGHNEARRAAALPRLALKRLTVLVERMVQFRRAIGRVQNRPLVEAVQCPCPVPLFDYRSGTLISSVARQASCRSLKRKSTICTRYV